MGMAEVVVPEAPGVLAAFGLLALWGAPPWIVVAFAAAGGQALALLR